MKPSPLNRFVRRDEVMRFCGLKQTALQDMLAKGEFPQPIKLNDTGRAVAWLESDLREWQNARILKARQTTEA